MMATIHQLACDVCLTPQDAFDGAIFTPAQIRQMYRDMGWKRKDGRDICPACVETAKQAA
jgi:uncharacterized Zn finger protein (UPF0148 family)